MTRGLFKIATVLGFLVLTTVIRAEACYCPASDGFARTICDQTQSQPLLVGDAGLLVTVLCDEETVSLFFSEALHRRLHMTRDKRDETEQQILHFAKTVLELVPPGASLPDILFYETQASNDQNLCINPLSEPELLFVLRPEDRIDGSWTFDDADWSDE